MKDQVLMYIAIGVGVALLLSLGIYAWSEYDKNQDTVTTKSTEITEVEAGQLLVDKATDVDTGDELQSSFESEYIGECVAGDETLRAYCQCTFDYMDIRLTNSEFLQMALDFYEDSSKMPDIMYNAIMECL